MKFIVTFILLFSIFAHADERVDRAFTSFFNNPVINSRLCGVNTQEFLKYLHRKGIDYSDGYVVSIHEGTAYLNHFNARWGSKESYQNGETYYRSNWYFHVFVVIDGKAYDFSQRDNEAFSLKDYLENSYLPNSETENIFFQGKLNRTKLLKKFNHMEMKIYPIEKYRTNLGPANYEGKYIELFNEVNISAVRNTVNQDREIIPPFEKRKYGQFYLGQGQRFVKAQAVQGNTFYKPYVLIKNIKYPIEDRGLAVCQALGYMGIDPSKTRTREITRKGAHLLGLSSTIYPSGPKIKLPDDIKVSFKYIENDQHWNYDVFDQVTCASLVDVI
jgi:hypothetical protein